MNLLLNFFNTNSLLLRNTRINKYNINNIIRENTIINNKKLINNCCPIKSSK